MKLGPGCNHFKIGENRAESRTSRSTFKTRQGIVGLQPSEGATLELRRKGPPEGRGWRDLHEYTSTAFIAVRNKR